MDRTSYFINNKALFGGYPSQELVNSLEEIGVKYFIDLTLSNEPNTTPYTTNHNIIRYPIKDMSVPEHMLSFISLIYRLNNILLNLQEGEKIFVHCRGGHGRAGIVVACLLYIFIYRNVDQSLRQTNICHNARLTMSDRWRLVGSPQTSEQKQFVRRVCDRIELLDRLANVEMLEVEE
jgi:protein tyrosine phosphatase